MGQEPFPELLRLGSALDSVLGLGMADLGRGPQPSPVFPLLPFCLVHSNFRRRVEGGAGQLASEALATLRESDFDKLSMAYHSKLS